MGRRIWSIQEPRLYDSFWLSAAESWGAEGKDQFEPGPAVEGAEARQKFRAAFGAEAAETVGDQARERLDELLTSRGDDGLLEHIERLGADAADDSTVKSQSLAIAGEIASRILRRRLFKAAGRASRTGAPAKELYRKYERPDARRRLEREAEEYAELGPAPKVAIWLPDPSMKVKPADVLVDYRGTINTFYSYEEDGSGRGSDIYSAHARLWGLWVFVDHGVSPEDRQIVLSFLSRELGVRWDEEDPMLGNDPTKAPDHLAAMLVSETDEANKKVEKLIETVATQVRARGEVKTFNELKTVYEQARDLPDDDEVLPS